MLCWDVCKQKAGVRQLLAYLIWSLVSKKCFVPTAATPAAGGLTGSSGGSGPSHLIPLQQPQAAGASFDPGVVCSLAPLHGGAARLASSGGGSGQQQFAPDAASAIFVPVRLCCCYLCPVLPGSCWQLEWLLSSSSLRACCFLLGLPLPMAAGSRPLPAAGLLPRCPGLPADHGRQAAGACQVGLSQWQVLHLRVGLLPCYC